MYRRIWEYMSRVSLYQCIYLPSKLASKALKSDSAVLRSNSMAGLTWLESMSLNKGKDLVFRMALLSRSELPAQKLLFVLSLKPPVGCPVKARAALNEASKSACTLKVRTLMIYIETNSNGDVCA